MLYLNFGLHFWAYGSVMFFITIIMRGQFVYKENYTLAMRMIFVLLTFGGEIVMLYYPNLFMISWYNMIFNIGGAIVGTMLAEMWAIHHRKKIQQVNLPQSICERYSTPDNVTITAEE